ncbi:MAG: hypothetical protein NTW32_10255 [Chloroflexi bacterium]|nr:hypothetical protein [Chloroflexota bacterium]
MIQTIRKTEHVTLDGKLVLYLPEFSGMDVDIIVLPRDATLVTETRAFMQVEELSGFAKKVLSEQAEDVWNDL